MQFLLAVYLHTLYKNFQCTYQQAAIECFPSTQIKGEIRKKEEEEKDVEDEENKEMEEEKEKEK